MVRKGRLEVGRVSLLDRWIGGLLVKEKDGWVRATAVIPCQYGRLDGMVRYGTDCSSSITITITVMPAMLTSKPRPIKPSPNFHRQSPPNASINQTSHRADFFPPLRPERLALPLSVIVYLLLPLSVIVLFSSQAKLTHRTVLHNQYGSFT
jgi:hypothetical protein